MFSFILINPLYLLLVCIYCLATVWKFAKEKRSVIIRGNWYFQINKRSKDDKIHRSKAQEIRQTNQHWLLYSDGTKIITAEYYFGIGAKSDFISWNR